MKELRKGFTTGAAAAASAKAAALGLRDGYIPEKVCITLPCGKILWIKIYSGWLEPKKFSQASVIKDAGDDPDITNGVEVIVSLRPVSSEEIYFCAGEGIGIVTKPGLSIPPGEPAINPVPRKMIHKMVREVFPKGGFEVKISIPGGKELAQKTFNPRLGIVGGLSILGTTGIVEPKSLEAIKETIKCEIDVFYHEVGKGPLGFVPGKIGEKALRCVFSEVKIVQMGNFLGFALSYARKKGIEKIILAGHPGKLAKVLMGYFDTHSQRSPQATKFVAEFLGLSGEFNTVEEVLQAVQSRKVKPIRGLDELARAIAEKLKTVFGFQEIHVLLFDMKQKLLGNGVAGRAVTHLRSGTYEVRKLMKIYIVSLGPGGEEYVTPLARKRIEQCEVIISFRGQILPSWLSQTAVFQENSLEAIFSRLEKNADRKIAILVSGDAGLFSLAAKVMERYGKEAVREIIPGISSLQVAFARIKEPWENVKVISFHGRKLDKLCEILSAQKIAVFCDEKNNSQRILHALAEAGLFKKRRRVFVCQNLTLPDEKIIEVHSEKDIRLLKPKRREIIVILEED